MAPTIGAPGGGGRGAVVRPHVPHLPPRRAPMKKSTKRFLWRYWGYGALLLLIYGWFVANFGPIILVGLSMLVTVYMLVKRRYPVVPETETERFVAIMAEE